MLRLPGVPDWAIWMAFLKTGTMSATLLTENTDLQTKHKQTAVNVERNDI